MPFLLLHLLHYFAIIMIIIVVVVAFSLDLFVWNKGVLNSEESFICDCLKMKKNVKRRNERMNDFHIL